MELNQNFSSGTIVVNNMFCPRCGKAEQLPETYCRQCGLFLPDLSKAGKRELPPEDHLKANAVLSSMTIITSLTLSILLFAFFGSSSDAHPLIYVTAGLLIGIGAWHIQTLIRTQKLKRQWKQRTPITQIEPAMPQTPPAIESAFTAKLSDPADFSGTIPANVADNITSHLAARVSRKAEAKTR